VIRAIDGSSNAVIPLSVRNGGAISMLDDDDVVEVPCVVNGEGAWPVHVDAVPDSVGPLLQRVKAYERATVRAALARTIDDARAALALNPLVPNRAAADALIDDLQPLW
jgi:6-phospho-beta-glucosidase